MKILLGILFSINTWALSPEDIKNPASSMNSSEQAKELADVGIKENLGGKLDLNLEFKNEAGQTVKLGEYFKKNLPVSISLIYFNCPGLCNFHFNGVIDALKEINWNPGEKFEVLAISFDSKETPDLAAKKKANYMKSYGRLNAEGGMHFLTADEETIKKLTSTIGFQYKWVPETKEWAHASAAVIATPEGTISRYLHGILFDGKTFKMALGEASRGQIGTLVERVIWYCFHYDPKQGKYTIAAFRVMQLGGIAIIIFLATLLLPVWIKGRMFR